MEMKIYRNKDFTIYTTIKDIKFEDWNPLINFKYNLFYKFANISTEERMNTYGIIHHDAWEKYFTKETGAMYGSYVGNGKTFIIPNEATEVIEFFNRNAPLHLFKKRKRISGLDCYAKHRDRFNDDFEHQLSFLKHDSRPILKGKWDKFVIDMAKDEAERFTME